LWWVKGMEPTAQTRQAIALLAGRIKKKSPQTTMTGLCGAAAWQNPACGLPKFLKIASPVRLKPSISF